jgi:hypothetical protein
LYNLLVQQGGIWVAKVVSASLLLESETPFVTQIVAAKKMILSQKKDLGLTSLSKLKRLEVSSKK